LCREGGPASQRPAGEVHRHGADAAALLGRGIDPFDAACTAVYLHGFAGDLLAEEMGDTGLAAMDLAERIPAAIQKLR